MDLLLKKLYDSYGFRAQELEFGPGLPVSYFESDTYEEASFLAQFREALEAMEKDS